MKIIDAHHHLWDLDTNKYTWLEKAKDHPSGDNPSEGHPSKDHPSEDHPSQ